MDNSRNNSDTISALTMHCRERLRSLLKLESPGAYKSINTHDEHPSRRTSTTVVGHSPFSSSIGRSRWLLRRRVSRDCSRCLVASPQYHRRRHVGHCFDGCLTGVDGHWHRLFYDQTPSASIITIPITRFPVNLQTPAHALLRSGLSWVAPVGTLEGGAEEAVSGTAGLCWLRHSKSLGGTDAVS